MKRFILSLMLLMIFTVCIAQSVNNKKETVYIDLFTKSNDVSSSCVERLRNSFIKKLMDKRRVNVIDLTSNEFQNAETIRGLKASFMYDTISIKNREDEMSALVNCSLIQGHVDSIITKESINDEGNVIYESKVNFTITIVDASTGVIETTETFESIGKCYNKESSIDYSLYVASYRMDDFVEENFKIRGAIVKLKDTKGKRRKKKAETVYINLGSDRELHKRQLFEVYEVVEIAGEKYEYVLGTIRVSEVVSEELSICKVINGGDRVLKFFEDKDENSDDTVLLVKSKKPIVFIDFFPCDIIF